MHERAFHPVYANTLLHICIEPVHHIHQCHLALYTTLHQFLDALGGEVHITLQQIVIGRVNVEKHLVNLGINLYCLTALAIQSSRTGIPQIRGTRQLTGELRHRILALASEQVRAVEGDTPHNGSLSSFVCAAFLQVQQHLEFYYFHYALNLGCKIKQSQSIPCYAKYVRTYILFRATKNLVQITRFYTYYPNYRR